MPRKHRRRAWGSITESERGRKYVLRWMENTPHGRKRVCETFYGTYREASSRLDAIHVLKGDAAPCPTVGQAIEMWYRPWLDRRLADGEISERTHAVYADTLRRAVLPRWRDVPFDSVKPLDVQSWLMGLSRGTADSSLIVLRKTGDFAVQYEVVEGNKFDRPYEMPKRKSKKKLDVYTYDQAEDAYRLMRGTSWEAAGILMLFGSCRPGESLGVKVDDVELHEIDGISYALVSIDRQVLSTGQLSGTLKTPESRRTVVVPPPYSLRLAELAKASSEYGSEWLTHAPDGDYMTYLQLDYQVRQTIPASMRIPLSNLRASWRTFAALEWKAENDTLELLMGHKLPGMTGRHYMRPSADQLLMSFHASFSAYLGKVR